MQDGDESDSTAAKHSHDEAQEGDHDQNMEGSSLAEETRMAHKKLRSLFKEMRKDKENQLAALADELKQGLIELQAYMQENIAQSIPPHLRHQFTFTTATVACIRRFERDTDQQMVELECHRDDEGTISEATARTASIRIDHTRTST